MFRRNLRSVTASSHVDAGGAVALRDIFIAPVALRFAAHFDALRRRAIRRRVRQLRSAWIADPENVARLFFFVLLVVFHDSLLFCDLAELRNRERQAPYRHFRAKRVRESDNDRRLRFERRARPVHLRYL